MVARPGLEIEAKTPWGRFYITDDNSVEFKVELG